MLKVFQRSVMFDVAWHSSQLPQQKEGLFVSFIGFMVLKLTNLRSPFQHIVLKNIYTDLKYQQNCAKIWVTKPNLHIFLDISLDPVNIFQNLFLC